MNNTYRQCQSTTNDGSICTREAVYKLDLTKGKKLFGVTIVPKINCCFFCTQHAKQLAVTGIIKATDSIFIPYLLSQYDEPSRFIVDENYREALLNPSAINLATKFVLSSKYKNELLEKLKKITT